MLFLKPATLEYVLAIKTCSSFLSRMLGKGGKDNGQKGPILQMRHSGFKWNGQNLHHRELHFHICLPITAYFILNKI